MTAFFRFNNAESGPVRTLPAAAPQADVEEAVKVVLRMLREHMGMDVVFVAQITHGQRQFRVVEAAVHGPAAAIAAGQGGGLASEGTSLDSPIVLRDGRTYGKLCCFRRGGDAAVAERDLRSLRYGARLAARLLDNQQVLRDLQREALQH